MQFWSKTLVHDCNLFTVFPVGEKIVEIECLHLAVVVLV